MATKRTLDFYIDSWLVQPLQHRISKEGKALRVEPKIMDVLVRLSEIPGETVTREDLLESVWEGTIVSDDVLTRSVSELRKIFNDNPRQPRIIETIPKIGYRLIPTPVVDHRGDSVPEHIPSLEVSPAIAYPEKPARTQQPGWLWGAAGASLVVLIGLLISWRAGLFSKPSVQSFAAIPLTTYPGFEGRPELSPDGKYVAFSWRGEEGDNMDVYIKLIGTESTLRLTDAPGNDFRPIWSPDGTQVAYVSRTSESCSVKIVPALGGTPRTLGSCGNSIYGDISWSSDGVTLAFNDRQEGDSAYSIHLYSIETGEKRKLTSPPGYTWGDHDPVFSPDGESVSFIRSISEGMQDLYRVSIEGGNPVRITNDSRNIVGQAWVDDDQLIFSSNRGGRFNLWRISNSGEHLTPVPVADENIFYPSIASGRLAYMKGLGETNIWQLTLDTTQALTPFIRSTRWDLHPQFSPNGERIAFTSNRSGFYEIWTSDSEGRNEARITNFNGPFTSTPRWSPDGSKLAFTSRPGGMAHIFVQDLNESIPRQLTLQEGNNLSPSWSHDGQWIYYSSNRTGSWQVWKSDLAGKTCEQITQDGGFGPIESDDGQYLYFAKTNEPGIWEMPLPSGNPVKIIDDLDPRDWGSWALNNRGIYYLRRGGRGLIAHFDLDTRKMDTLYVVQKPVPVMDPALDIHPDGTRLLIGQVERNESDLMMIEGID